MKFFPLIVALLAFGVTACGDAKTDAEQAVGEASAAAEDLGNDIQDGTADMMDKANGMADEAAGMTSINETVSAVRNAGGDITALSPDVAVSNIDSWIAKLDGMDGTGEVVGNLKTLKAELTDGDIDGAKVGTILNALAEDTQELAPDNVALQGLSKALAAGGEKLGGM